MHNGVGEAAPRLHGKARGLVDNEYIFILMNDAKKLRKLVRDGGLPIVSK